VNAAEPPARGPGGLAVTASATLVVQLATYLLMFVVSILLARGLGAVGRGEYYLPVTVAMTGIVLVNLGLEAANTFVVSERRHTLRQVAAASTFLAPLAGLAGAGMLTVLYLATDESLLQGVSWGAFLIPALLLPIQLHLLWAMNIFALGGRTVRAQAAQLAGAAVQILLLLPPLLAGNLTVLYALGTYTAWIVVPWALLVMWSRSFAPLWPVVDSSVVRHVVGYGLKLQVSVIFVFLLFRSDIFFVNLLLGRREVGVYSVAVILAEPVMLLAVPLVLAVLPMQAAMAIEDAGRLSFRTARFSGAFALALAAGVAAIMWPAVPLLFGDDFKEAYVALVMLLPGIVALSISRALGNWLLRQDRPWVLAALGAAAFVVNAVLNVLLLPVMGIAGASLASSIAYVGLTAAMIAWGLPHARLSLREALVPSRDDIAAAQRGVASVVRRLRKQ
jgi:O-antigen/teichoic acid export membrane protein